MHRPKTCLLTAVAAAGAVPVAACDGSSSAPSPGAGAAAPVRGGTLVATYQGEPQGLDPAIDWEGQGWAIEHTLFDTFIKCASKPGRRCSRTSPPGCRRRRTAA